MDHLFCFLYLALDYLPGGPPLKYFRPCNVSQVSSGWITVVPLQREHKVILSCFFGNKKAREFSHPFQNFQLWNGCGFHNFQLWNMNRSKSIGLLVQISSNYY